MEVMVESSSTISKEQCLYQNRLTFLFFLMIFMLLLLPNILALTADVGRGVVKR